MSLRGSVVAGLSCLSMAVWAGNAYFVPTGDSPFDWSDVGNWYTADGAPFGQLPSTDDYSYLQSDRLNNGKIVIPAGGGIDVNRIYLGADNQPPLTLEICSGASLNLGHSSNVRGLGTDIIVRDGAAVTNVSYLYLGCGGNAKARLLIDEGGSYVQNGVAPLFVCYYRTAKATVENHGTHGIVNSSVYVGSASSVNSAATATGVYDNYGTLVSDSHSNPLFCLGAYPYCTGIFTNHVGATVDLSMPFTVGGSSNATAYAYNYGTFNVKASRVFNVGGDHLTSTGGVTKASKASKGFAHNYGEMNLSGTTRIGGWSYCTGEFTNHSNATLTVGGALTLAYKAGATGRLVLEEGSTTSAKGAAYVGYYGAGTVRVDGLLDRSEATGAMFVSDYTGSTGTVQVSTTGRIKGAGRGLYIAGLHSGAVGDVSLVGDAVVENTGIIYMATGGTSQATLTLSDNARIDGANTLFVGCGNASEAKPQSARAELRDNAQITNFNGHIYIGSGSYGSGELILSDQAKITRAEKPNARSVYIANSSVYATGTLTLRGGTLELSSNATVCVGRNSSTSTACNGFIRGWGVVDRIRRDLNGTADAAALTLYCGAITADGEGELRDLDLSVIRKVNDGGMNLSGTNGWYAVNKGRLYFPSRNSGYVNLGDYYSRADGPYYVNGVKFAFKGKESTGYLHGQLYATDRDDIPAGLPEDNLANGIRRLGVWRAGLSTSTWSERFGVDTKRGGFTSATATIRYDNFRLGELKDEDGAFRNGQYVRLYRYTGTEWKTVTTRKAEEAEADHLISGEILPVDDDWNMGFFAVVAVRSPSTAILVR